jgi:hypothetical protein
MRCFQTARGAGGAPSLVAREKAENFGRARLKSLPSGQKQRPV